MNSSIARIVEARTRDLGGFSVARVLPFAGGTGVGPFVFLDHMGPARFAPGREGDVRPHPHIGLATVTWLFEGEMVHRDSLGFVETIRPGEVNWMTAGRGIVHSERFDAAVRARGLTVQGMQAWVALPDGHEEIAPAFHHHDAAHVPVIEENGATIRLIAGRAWGVTSPVKTFSPLFYAEVTMSSGATIELPAEYVERAIYVVEGTVRAGGMPVAPRFLAIATADGRVVVEASGPSRVMLLGGSPVGQRHLWWNFVSSSKNRIERAKADWREGRFTPVPGENEFIPLPQA